MTTFPNSPKLLQGGLVLIDPETAMVQRIIALQYNPDSLSRTLQIKGMGRRAASGSTWGLISTICAIWSPARISSSSACVAGCDSNAHYS